jgi:hypothetical protein
MMVWSYKTESKFIPCIFIIQNKFATDDDKGKIFRCYMLDVANDFLVLLIWQAAAWIEELPVCKG